MQIVIDKELVLNNLKTEDAELLAFHANDPELASNLKDSFPFPYTVDDAIEFIARYKSSNFKVKAIRYNGEVVGIISLTRRKTDDEFEAELGYWIGRKCWGKGLMTRCVRGYANFVFENSSITRIYAKIFKSNTSSIRVIEKCGFVKNEGLSLRVIKNGEMLDTVVYELVKNPEI